MNRKVLSASIASLLLFAGTRVSLGYVDLAPTLSKVVGDSAQIIAVEVTAYDPAAKTLELKAVKTLKGTPITEPVKQTLTSGGSPVPRQVLLWAGVGARGVFFTRGNTGLVCFGQGWYAVKLSMGEWKIGDDRPDLPLAYYGTEARLEDSIEKMLAGKSAIITMVPHGAEEAASFELALNRQNLPGLIKLQRLRATLDMPGNTMAISANPAYVVGQGAVGEEELPELLNRVKSSDKTVVLGAVEDLRTLGKPAAGAAETLAGLLKDSDAHLRCTAASALMRIAPKDGRGVAILADGLGSAQPTIRKDAATAAGLAGAAAAPLAEKLGQLLQDKDEGVRVAALQAIAMLGPDAAKAEPAVEPLLNNPAMAIDAADALGRMGLAARPAMKALATLVADKDYATHWAGIRAMAQIGGPESKPAVDFMIAMFSSGNFTEVEGYNSMVYLSLIGPDAKAALPVVQSIRIKNPVLPGSTAWALQSDQYLPWQATGGRNFPGGGNGGMNIGSIIYEAYINELGYRLKPAAKLLAAKIMDGTAGDIPDYGYRMLATGDGDVAEMLAGHLGDDNQQTRERAEVALGFMGPAALAVKPKVMAAKGKISDPKETKLVEWCLRQMDAESD